MASNVYTQHTVTGLTLRRRAQAIGISPPRTGQDVRGRRAENEQDSRDTGILV